MAWPNAFQLYVQLADNADLNKISGKIKDEKLKNVNAQLAKKKPVLFLHPMNKWHLYSEFKDGLNTGGRIKYVWLFGIIGAFVLLTGCKAISTGQLFPGGYLPQPVHCSLLCLRLASRPSKPPWPIPQKV